MSRKTTGWQEEMQMRAGMVMLCLAYLLSQFFRSFLAVLSTVLQADIGAGPDDLALASGLWFLVFAVMQLPVGWSLDRIGPKRTASFLMMVGGAGGALVFSLATTPVHIIIAMALIGVGCAPALMASYYIFAREFSAAHFATLAAVMLGTGSIGNIVASYPVAWANDMIGWRAAMMLVAALAALVAVGIYVWVRDPERVNTDEKGSVLDLLRMPVLWPLFLLMIVNYAPSGAVRGLWIGPYLSDVFALTTAQVGQASLVMGLAMIAGTFFFGPLDRVFGTRKWIIFAGNGLCALSILALAVLIEDGAVLSIALLAAVGFLGMTYPIIIAHARSFFPAHLTGRGVTLMNLFGMGGIGIMQFASGRIHGAVPDTSSAGAPYAAIFAFFGLALLAGLVVYAFSRDSVD
jgi:MFS family permease